MATTNEWGLVQNQQTYRNKSPYYCYDSVFSKNPTLYKNNVDNGYLTQIPEIWSKQRRRDHYNYQSVFSIKPTAFPRITIECSLYQNPEYYSKLRRRDHYRYQSLFDPPSIHLIVMKPFLQTSTVNTYMSVLYSGKKKESDKWYGYPYIASMSPKFGVKTRLHKSDEE